MGTPSFRQIAARLGLSVATVSRALHQDPAVHPATARRVTEAMRQADYQLDPVVSTGMSKVRRRSFYRETLAWCGDRPRKQMPWLEPMFQSAESYGARLGYKIDYFHFASAKPAALERLAAVWKARGIRGVLLGPFHDSYRMLPFPWEAFAWISVGQYIRHPVLHNVSRDYQADFRHALAWLDEQGCRRPGFVLYAGARNTFEEPMLQAALLHDYRVRRRPGSSYCELDPARPEAFAAWVRSYKPDGVILPGAWAPALRRVTKPLAALPTVLLSPQDPTPPRHLHFTAQYEIVGQASVNLMHRLLGNREFGIPAYKQSVMLSAKFSQTADRRRL